MYTILGLFSGIIFGYLVSSICGMNKSSGFAATSGDFFLMASILIGGGIGIGIEITSITNGTHIISNLF
jgi:hypothetical protein